MIGVYKIVNLDNGKIYVGSSIDVHTRIRKHKEILQANNHINKRLQNSYNVHGKDKFEFLVIEECNLEDIIICEQKWIDTLNPEYNIHKIARSPRGYKHTQKAKDAIGKANANRIWTEESKNKARLSRLGCTHTKEAKDKVSKAVRERVIRNNNFIEKMIEKISNNDVDLYEENRMVTLSAKNHEKIMMNRYNKACAEWKPEHGGFPQIGFYGFHKNYGYVTFDLELHTSCWRETKKESIEAFKQLINSR